MYIYICIYIYIYAYKYKCPTADINCDVFDNPINLLDKIKESERSLAKTKNDQIGFKSNLGEIK